MLRVMFFRREPVKFGLTLACLVAAFLSPALVPGRVLSPADLISVQLAREGRTPAREPQNRLLIDPVLQFEPWLAFTRCELRAGRWPLWNPWVGCGAPHLANGQSAVFDPFHLIAYVGTLPEAHVWMAFARLWVAGLGMFLLADSWGLGKAGRWFAGLTYPFCGFLVLWLLFPLASSALWLPWLFWGIEGVLRTASARSTALTGVILACSVFGGQVQAVAHNVMAVSLYVAWRMLARTLPRPGRRALAMWAVGIVLGVALSAVQWVPLVAYLTRSPVWSDRAREHASSTWGRPRMLDAACTAIPYLYGSQRAGHPNVARVLGVHNLNESAGGFVGLAVLLWLAPVAWVRRGLVPRVGFLFMLLVAGALLAFEIPPFIQVVRGLPVLGVIDHRRLTHWVAFALVLFGAHGIDGLRERVSRGISRRFARVAFVLAAFAGCAAVVVPRLEPWMRERVAVYRSETTSDASAQPSAAIHARHVEKALEFYPGYFAWNACVLLAIAGLAQWHARPGVEEFAAAPENERARWSALLPLTLALVELFAFGVGLNPAIARSEYQPRSALVDFLRMHAPPPARVLPIGDLWHPNMLMRYGICDFRNYDSIELSASLDPAESLYTYDDPRRVRTSRRLVDWNGVWRARAHLEAAGVRVVVAGTPPPEGWFEHLEAVAGVYVVRLPARRAPPRGVAPGEIRIDEIEQSDKPSSVPVTFDPGWKARDSRGPLPVWADERGFLATWAREGARRVDLRYDPVEFRVGLGVSLVAVLGLAWLMVKPASGMDSGK